MSFWKTLPALFSNLLSVISDRIKLKEKELPMKFDEHEERKGFRVVDAKWDAEKRDDKGQKADTRRDLRMSRWLKRKNRKRGEKDK